jgi:hypothetical protein
VDHEAEKPVQHQVAKNLKMSYQRFPNLREMSAKYLASKLTEGIQSLDFIVRDCNCKDQTGKGRCQYGNMCRVPIVIYKITCKMTNKIYIENTQQNFKKRMTGHFQDVRSYAQHVTGIWPRGAEVPTPGMQRNLIKCNILWKGNPSSVVIQRKDGDR